MPDENRGALVRWRPGQFLGLNDIAYAHGGRISVVHLTRGVAATRARWAGNRRSRTFPFSNS